MVLDLLYGPDNSVLNRNVTSTLTTSNTITITASSVNNHFATISVNTAFSNPVQIFDTIIINTGSVIAGAGNQNVGSFLVYGYSSNGLNSILVEKLSGLVNGSPTTVTAANFSVNPSNDIVVYARSVSGYRFDNFNSKTFNRAQVANRASFGYKIKTASNPPGFPPDLDTPLT
jgi:hypothetical protein